MAFIVVSRAVAVSSPSSTATAVTRADVVAFGASMLLLSSIGRWTPPQGTRLVDLLSVLRSPGGLLCWGAVGGQGVGQGLVQWGGVGTQLGGDLAAVDDEGLLELVLQLDQFPHGGVDDPEGSQQQHWGATKLGAGLAGEPVDAVDQLAGGPGLRVVGEVPDLARGVGVLAQDRQAFADVGDVGVGVGLVGVAQDGGGLAGQRGREDAVAQVGLGAAARAEVVRGPAGGDLDPSGLVGGQQLAGHAGAELPLLGVGRMRAGLGEGLAVGAPVHVDVLHADQPGPGGFGGGKHAGLEGGEQLDPLVVGRVEGLVEDLLAAAAEGLQGGQADGAGPEDHMPWAPTHDGSARPAPSPIVVVLMLVFPSGAQVLASRPAGSWSDMPVGQATSLALMASSLPICDRLAPADHARADRGDAGSCRCQPPAVLGGYRANALVGAGCKGGGAAGLVMAPIRASSPRLVP